MSDNTPYAFTGRFTLFRNRIVSDVLLCSPSEGNTNAIRIRALWDTGCSHSIVSARAAEFLQLPVDGRMQFRSPFGGVALCDMAVARICVVLGAAKIPLRVGISTKPNSDPDCDITLGLDFITQGDFALSHDGEQLALSFCYPPIGSPVDFTFLAPRLIGQHVETLEQVINESDAVESRRRSLSMLDSFRPSEKN